MPVCAQDRRLFEFRSIHKKDMQEQVRAFWRQGGGRHNIHDRMYMGEGAGYVSGSRKGRACFDRKFWGKWKWRGGGVERRGEGWQAGGKCQPGLPLEMQDVKSPLITQHNTHQQNTHQCLAWRQDTACLFLPSSAEDENTTT